MQPSIENGTVVCVYLHRYDEDKKEPEILRLVDGLGPLLDGFPELGEEYTTWKAHNEARTAAGMEQVAVPPSLQHYARVARLEERTHAMHYKSDKPEDHDTVAVTAEEAASIDALKLGPESPTLSLQATSFLMKVCEFFDTEAEQADANQ